MKDSQTNTSTSAPWRTLAGVFANVLRGAAIGIANIIPGVSGGTIAVILRIYERLITAIRDFLSFGDGWVRRALFLLQIVVGAGIGLLALARVIEYLLESHGGPTQLFFIGLILGSVPALLRQSKALRLSAGQITSFLIAFAVVAGISLLGGAETGTVYAGRGVSTALLLVSSGVAGAAAMVVPGISGSFLLLLIGSYGTIIHGINTLDPFILGSTAVGVLIGLGIITRVIAWLFGRLPGPTYAAILGLVAGSLVRLWPQGMAGLEWLWGVLALAAGGAIALALGRRRPRVSDPPEEHRTRR